MSNENFNNTPEENLTIIIDIEELFLSDEKHPQHDPGTIILYRIKVDERYHNIAHPHITGKAILALEDRSPEYFEVKQRFKEHGATEWKLIQEDETVDLAKPGIERFITEKRLYTFYIGPKDYQTEHSHLTVRQILVDYAKVNPEKKSLAIKQGQEFHTYEDLNERIHLVPVKHFILFDNTPTGKS